MRCDEVQNLLVEFIEDELGAAERAAFAEHLAECDACASELAAYEHTMSLLEDDGYVEPEPFYWTRFEAGLRAKLRGRRERFVLVPRFANLNPRLAPIAVAVLFFCVGLGVGLQPVLQLAGGGDDPASFADRSFDVGEPVISPRSKALVQSGLSHDVAQYAANTADTLTPESFDSAIEEPVMILATDEVTSDVERFLGESLLRD
jgi:anti-sigma factor RsiW